MKAKWPMCSFREVSTGGKRTEEALVVVVEEGGMQFLTGGTAENQPASNEFYLFNCIYGNH
jgi:hypothetical protein